MPDARMISEQVQARIAEIETIIAPLQAERDQLRAVAASFGPADIAPAVAPAAVRRTRRVRTAPAAGGGAVVASGSRAEEAVKLIVARPGLTAAEVAAAMGISRNYLYRVLPKLEQSGVITKKGKGYHPV